MHRKCSLQVDIWSFGVVLWELLTCEMPYKDFDSSAIIWGVGNHSLHLPLPNSIPEGFKLLVKQCWSTKPKNRPSFRIILSHLEIACAELLANHRETYYEKSVTWRKEVSEQLQTSINNSVRVKHSEKVRAALWRNEILAIIQFCVFLFCHFLPS